MSEHSFGLTDDISKIDEAVVKNHWNDSSINGKKLRTAAKKLASILPMF